MRLSRLFRREPVVPVLLGVALPLALFFGFRSQIRSVIRSVPEQPELSADSAAALQAAWLEEYLEPRTELRVVVLFSTMCGASRDPRVASAVREARGSIEAKWGEPNELRFVGVGIDWDVEESLAMLENMGSMDEVVIGGNWNNLATEKYFWAGEGRLASASTPQILITSRVIERTMDGFELGREELIRTIDGLYEIIAWQESGVPIGPVEVSNE